MCVRRLGSAGPPAETHKPHLSIPLLCSRTFACLCLCVNLLVGLLLGQCGRYKARLAGKDVPVQVQRRDVISCVLGKKQRSQGLFSLSSLNPREGENMLPFIPCMDMEGATEATGIGGMETPPKEL